MATQNVVLKILADVAGANASFAKMNKALQDLSGGALTLGKNFNVFKEGVRGSIGAQKAAEQVSKQYLAVMRQRLNISKAEAAGIRAVTEMHRAEAAAINAKLALQRAELAADNIALREMQQELQLRRLAVQEIEIEKRERMALTNVKKQGAVATRQTAQATTDMAHANGSASFALLSLTQGIQDAGQFGMGWTQGIRAINNNLQQFVTATILASNQTKGMGSALLLIAKQLKGPAGFLFLFSAASAAVEFFSNKMQGSRKAAREAEESIRSLYEAMGTAASVTLTTVEQVDSLIEAYSAISPETFGRGKEEIGEFTRALRDLRAEIILNNAVYREQLEARGRDGILLDNLIAKNRELGEERKNLLEPLQRERGYQWELNVVLEETNRLLKEQEDARRRMFLTSFAGVGDQGETIGDLQERTRLMVAAADAGMASTSEFITQFNRINAILRAIDEQAVLTQEKFASLWAEDGIEAYIARMRELHHEETELEKVLKAIKEEQDAINSSQQMSIAIRSLELDLTQQLREHNDENAQLRYLLSVLNTADEEHNETLLNQIVAMRGVNEQLREKVRLKLIERGFSKEEIEEILGFGDAVDKDADAAERALNRLNAAFIRVASDGIGSMIEGLAVLAVSGGSAADRLLAPLADMAIRLGKLSIATGITIKGIKESLRSLNPVVAIAAGAALVALGSAVKAKVKGMSSGGSSSASSSGGYGITRASFSDYNPPGSREEFMSGGLGAQFMPARSPNRDGPWPVEFRIRGRDLVGVVDGTRSADTRMGLN